MATARADPLRSTLDNLQLDPRSEADRPYLVAMLRRLGYTEREIEEVVRTGKMPREAPEAGALSDDGLAPAREYHLVVPASDSRFALDTAPPAAATDAPFEDLERVEFEDQSDLVEFEEVAPGEDLQWEDAEAQGAPDERTGAEADEVQWGEVPAAEGEPQAEPAEGLDESTEWPAAEPAEPGFEEGSIDTFGNPEALAPAPRTRVRVRRVRAASKEEAERKVAGSGRNVIKSVPVDIVERWGPGGEKAKAPKKDPETEG